MPLHTQPCVPHTGKENHAPCQVRKSYGSGRLAVLNPHPQLAACRQPTLRAPHNMQPAAPSPTRFPHPGLPRAHSLSAGSGVSVFVQTASATDPQKHERGHGGMMHKRRGKPCRCPASTHWPTHAPQPASRPTQNPVVNDPLHRPPNQAEPAAWPAASALKRTPPPPPPMP